MKKFLSFICALLCVILCFGCTPCECGESLPCAHFSGEEAFSRYSGSVVEVLSSTDRGSGIIIDGNETEVVIATCYHLCGSDLTTTSVRFKGEDAFTREGITLLGYDQRNDITIFKMSKRGAKLPSVSVPLVMGEQVYLMGNGEGKGVAISDGVIALTEFVAKYDGSNYYKPLIKTTALSVGGNSGGLIVNASGVVGMSVATSEDFSLALPYEIALALYQNAKSGGINYPSYSIASGEVSEGGLLKRQTTVTIEGEAYIYKEGSLIKDENTYKNINGESVASTLSGLVAQIVKTEGERVTLS